MGGRGTSSGKRAPRAWAVTAMKVVSLLSLTRVYNIALIAAAQYLSCMFFFTFHAPDFSVLTDPHFFVLVVCTWMVVAGGYIINFFYDKNKDLVNYPEKGFIDGYISQSSTLKIYLTLNFAAVALSLFVSLRSVVFFSGFAFLLWFYSHKLKKIPLVSNFAMAALAMIPLFAVFFYRKVVDINVLVSHGMFLFFLLSALSMLGDLNNRRGDAVFGYRTLPVVLGERKASAVTAAVLAAAAACTVTVLAFEKGNAYFFYFLFTGLALLIAAVALLARPSDKVCSVIYTGVKVTILIGLLCIPLRIVPLDC